MTCNFLPRSYSPTRTHFFSPSPLPEACGTNFFFVRSAKMGRIELGDITCHNLKQLQRVNEAVFPVIYTKEFYEQILELGDIAKFAYYNDIVVGAVCGHIERVGEVKKMYLMTLGCLRPYRKQGVGTMLLNYVLKYCKDDGRFSGVYLHVQVNNQEALDFYEKFGFKNKERKENYYTKVDPPDAFLLEKDLEVTEEQKKAKPQGKKGKK